MLRHHWDGNRLSLDLSLPQCSASPSGLPALSCGLAHETAPPHEGLRGGRERWSKTARKGEGGGCLGRQTQSEGDTESQRHSSKVSDGEK